MKKPVTCFSIAVLSLASVLALGLGCSKKAESSGKGQPESGATKAHPVVVTTETFAKEVEQAEGLVVVDFWATWCGPCRAIAPALKELAAEYDGRVKVAKVDVDKNGELAQRFQIQSIPNLILFKGGKAIDSQLGARSKADYQAWFDKHL